MSAIVVFLSPVLSSPRWYIAFDAPSGIKPRVTRLEFELIPLRYHLGHHTCNITFEWAYAKLLFAPFFLLNVALTSEKVPHPCSSTFSPVYLMTTICAIWLTYQKIVVF